MKTTSITGRISDTPGGPSRHATILDVIRKPWSEDFTKQMMRDYPDYWRNHQYQDRVADEKQVDDPYWNTLLTSPDIPNEPLLGGHHTGLSLLTPPLPISRLSLQDTAGYAENESAMYLDRSSSALSRVQAPQYSEMQSSQEGHHEYHITQTEDYENELVPANSLSLDNTKHWPVLDINGNILYSELLDPKLFKPLLQDSVGRHGLTYLASLYNCQIEGLILPSGENLLM